MREDELRSRPFRVRIGSEVFPATLYGTVGNVRDGTMDRVHSVIVYVHAADGSIVEREVTPDQIEFM